MPTKLVTVTTALNGTVAQFMVNRLKEAGIDATIADDNVVTMDFMFAPAVGWIKVQVREQDLERAELVLAANEPPVDEKEIPWDQPPGEEEEEDDEDDETSLEERERKLAERTAPVEIDPDQAETDQLINRAYKCAILGPFLLPPILNVFSIYLLWQADTKSKRLSDSSARRSTIAFMVDMFMLLTTGWIWILLLVYSIMSIFGIR